MTTESLRATPEQRTYIRTLFARHGNRLSSDQLVKAAEAQNSPIHDLFTWNNRRAAHLYRLRQAARILRSYTGWLPAAMKHTGGKDIVKVLANKIPMAVKVKPSPDEEPTWVQTSNVLENGYMRQQMIVSRISGVKHAIRQLLAVPELEDLYHQLNTAIDRYKTVIVPRGERRKPRVEAKNTKEKAHVR